MIALVSGELIHLGLDHVVVEAGGLGYKVYIPLSTRSKLSEVGSCVRLFTHYHVKEDGVALYGFLSAEERDLFELLQTVNGVGPKVALGVLSGAGPRDFLRAVLYEDVASLTKLPGVGKKTAQRLVMELKEKVGQLWDGTADKFGVPTRDFVPADPVTEAVEALVSLGYSRAEAAKAVEKAGQEAAAGAEAPAGTGKGSTAQQGPGAGKATVGGTADAGELVRRALRKLS